MPSLPQDIGRPHRHLDQRAAGDHRDVVAGAQLHGAAEPERGLRIAHRRFLRAAAESKVDRPVDVERGQRGLIGFVDVGGDDDRHVRQAAHQRQILERMMRAAGHAKRDAARGSADHHALIRVGDVVAHLLHAARGDERRIGAHVGTQAGGRETGRDADRVLLGDAHLDEAIAIAFDVGTDPEQILSVGGQHHRARLACGELEQRLAEGKARLVGGAGAPVGGVAVAVVMAHPARRGRARRSRRSRCCCARDRCSRRSSRPCP